MLLFNCFTMYQLLGKTCWKKSELLAKFRLSVDHTLNIKIPILQAIKLLTPPCESNRKDRLQAHLLRGRALVGLKVPKVGLLDFEHAVSLTPLDDALKHEVKRVRELAELPEDSEGEADFSSPPLVITQWKTIPLN